jgi:hypothetical protein
MEGLLSNPQTRKSTRTRKEKSWKDDLVDDDVFEDHLKALEEIDESDIEGKCLLYADIEYKVRQFD